MSVSQFTVYTGSDANGPGLISGTAGSLLTVLDGCLVNGYTGKTAAGWTKPIANSGSIGCYKQGAGAGLNLLINDDGPNATSTFKEAWAVGWETLASIASTVGTGTGQFPLPAQLNSGNVVVRKSSAASSAGNYWVLFADASTFYLFIQTGDSAGTYYGLWFGDMFSLAGSADTYRCFVLGNNAENGTASQIGNLSTTPNLNPGAFSARSWGGTGSSVGIGVVGDTALDGGAAGIQGNLQSPNGPDNSFYLCPLRVTDATPLIRGRFRGLYQVCHLAANFTDGQTFAGGGDYAGKSFRIVKALPNNASTTAFVAVETSNTVETN